jgi:hypothetical protein
MAKKAAFSEERDIILDYNATGQLAAPIDFYKAVMVKIEEMEAAYAAGSLTTDLAAASVLLVGANRNQIHVADVTTTLASGTYTFDYVETVPDASQVS